MMYKIDVSNVVSEYGDQLDFFVDGESVSGVVAFFPITGEIEVLANIGGGTMVDAYNDIVTAKFTPLHLKATFRSTGKTAYERNLRIRPIMC